jgi:hypothetical protein
MNADFSGTDVLKSGRSENKVKGAVRCGVGVQASSGRYDASLGDTDAAFAVQSLVLFVGARMRAPSRALSSIAVRTSVSATEAAERVSVSIAVNWTAALRKQRTSRKRSDVSLIELDNVFVEAYS